MGLYFRKSKSLGSIRLNFSKSGLGISTGVTGARLIFSPKGTYVHLGRHGIYYKKKISTGEDSDKSDNYIENEVKLQQEGQIETLNFDNLTDVDSQDFVNELEAKDKKIGFSGLFTTIWMLGLIAITVIFFIPLQPLNENQSFITITKDVVNIRENNATDSEVMLKAIKGDEFKILDDTSYTRWIVIEAEEKNGFVYRSLTKRIEKSVNYGSLSRFDNNPLIVYASYPIYFILFILLVIKLNKLDRKRKSIEIYYELDDEMNDLYNSFINSFRAFSKTKKVWQINSKSSGHDSKYHGGASTLINRVMVKEIASHKLPMRFFKTNADIPYIGLLNIKLFFLPERILIKRGAKYAAIMYKNLKLDSMDSRFVEDSSVPSDAQIVDYTWKYVNKKGGPDKRFSNNSKIPVCLYTNYYLKSDNGVNEIIMTSKTGALDDFENVIRSIKELKYTNSDIKVYSTNYKPENETRKLLSLLQNNDFIKPTDIQIALSCGYSKSNRLLDILLQLEAIAPHKSDSYKVMQNKIDNIESELITHIG